MRDVLESVLQELDGLKKPERHRPSCQYMIGKYNWRKRKCACGVSARNDKVDALKLRIRKAIYKANTRDISLPWVGKKGVLLSLRVTEKERTLLKQASETHGGVGVSRLLMNLFHKSEGRM